MREHLLSLYEVQKIDATIFELQGRRSSIPQHLQELEARAVSLTAELEVVAEQIETVENEAKGLEAGTQADAQKVRKWDTRLQDIRNQREYLALSREIEGAKRAIKGTEEKVLELWKSKDTLVAQQEELKDKLAEAEIARTDENDNATAKLAAVEEEVAQLTTRRESLLPGLPVAMVRKYDMIRSKRRGLGLASVIDGSCQGCNVRLRPQLYNILQRGDTIEQCPSCQRLLVWEQHIPAENAPAAQVEAGQVDEAIPTEDNPPTDPSSEVNA